MSITINDTEEIFENVIREFQKPSLAFSDIENLDFSRLRKMRLLYLSIMKIPGFNNFLNINKLNDKFQVEKSLETFNLKTYKKGEILIDKNEKFVNFYGILKGKVGCYTTREYYLNIKNSEEKYVITKNEFNSLKVSEQENFKMFTCEQLVEIKNRGYFFDEIKMIYGILSEYKYIILEDDTKICYLKNSDFYPIFTRSIIKTHNDYKEFIIKHIPSLSYYTNKSNKSFFEILRIKVLEFRNYLIKEGEYGINLYVVLSGILRVNKNVNINFFNQNYLSEETIETSAFINKIIKKGKEIKETLNENINVNLEIKENSNPNLMNIHPKLKISDPPISNVPKEKNRVIKFKSNDKIFKLTEKNEVSGRRFSIFENSKSQNENNNKKDFSINITNTNLNKNNNSLDLKTSSSRKFQSSNKSLFKLISQNDHKYNDFDVININFSNKIPFLDSISLSDRYNFDNLFSDRSDYDERKMLEFELKNINKSKKKSFDEFYEQKMNQAHKKLESNHDFNLNYNKRKLYEVDKGDVIGYDILFNEGIYKISANVVSKKAIVFEINLKKIEPLILEKLVRKEKEKYIEKENFVIHNLMDIKKLNKKFAFDYNKFGNLSTKFMKDVEINDKMHKINKQIVNSYKELKIKKSKPLKNCIYNDFITLNLSLNDTFLGYNKNSDIENDDIMKNSNNGDNNSRYINSNSNSVSLNCMINSNSLKNSPNKKSNDIFDLKKANLHIVQKSNNNNNKSNINIHQNSDSNKLLITKQKQSSFKAKKVIFQNIIDIKNKKSSKKIKIGFDNQKQGIKTTSNQVENEYEIDKLKVNKNNKLTIKSTILNSCLIWKNLTKNKTNKMKHLDDI